MTTQSPISVEHERMAREIIHDVVGWELTALNIRTLRGKVKEALTLAYHSGRVRGIEESAEVAINIPGTAYIQERTYEAIRKLKEPTDGR